MGPTTTDSCSAAGSPPASAIADTSTPHACFSVMPGRTSACSARNPLSHTAAARSIIAISAGDLTSRTARMVELASTT